MNAKQRALVQSDYVGVVRAAQSLGISARQVRNLIYSKTLSHAKHGGKYVVPTAAIEAYKAERLVVGSVA